jgi:tRNA G18 (ribose-2'-O)-methylase SpoU
MHCADLDALVTSVQADTSASINALLMTSPSSTTSCEDLFLHAWQWHKVNLLVLGSEQAGLSASTVQASCLQEGSGVSRHALSLPMAPAVESLNVGHAMAMTVAVAMSKL